MTGVQTCALPICFPVTIKSRELGSLRVERDGLLLAKSDLADRVLVLEGEVGVGREEASRLSGRVVELEGLLSGHGESAESLSRELESLRVERDGLLVAKSDLSDRVFSALHAS